MLSSDGYDVKPSRCYGFPINKHSVVCTQEKRGIYIDIW